MTLVFVALGGNIGDTEAVFHRALQRLRGIKGISHLEVSSFYQTSPVSPIMQRDYVNAVCCFETSWSLLPLFERLQTLEKELGKNPKHQNAPRILDLDLLFFGKTRYSDANLQVPHPRFSERQFVLVPLLELLEKIL